MRVTRKEFVDALTNNRSVFEGVTNRVWTHDEVDCVVCPSPADFVNERIATAHSTFLEFTGGSRLYLDGCTFGRYDFPGYDFVVYFAEQKNGGKVMWYRV